MKPLALVCGGALSAAGAVVTVVVIIAGMFGEPSQTGGVIQVVALGFGITWMGIGAITLSLTAERTAT